MARPTCCGHAHDAHVHVLDEIGTAVETRCEICRVTCAQLVRMQAGSPRVWLMRGGETNTNGIPARRPRIGHTCRLSDLPCAACERRGGDGKRRRGFGPWMRRRMRRRHSRAAR